MDGSANSSMITSTIIHISYNLNYIVLFYIYNNKIIIIILFDKILLCYNNY